MKNISVIGASGALGSTFIQVLSNKYPNATVHALSRKKRIDVPELSEIDYLSYQVDYFDEQQIKETAKQITSDTPLDLVIVATGILHEGDITPEKTLSQISADKLTHLFRVNTMLPALMAKHFIPKLNKSHRSMFMALSARIGSISDNGLGGWYSYRASKAALNMLLKTAAIETARKNPHAIIVGMHPGTVDSDLSKPFQKNIPADKLFTPEYSVTQMLAVLDSLSVADTGKCFGWEGKEILP